MTGLPARHRSIDSLIASSSLPLHESTGYALLVVAHERHMDVKPRNRTCSFLLSFEQLFAPFELAVSRVLNFDPVTRRLLRDLVRRILSLGKRFLPSPSR